MQIDPNKNLINEPPRPALVPEAEKTTPNVCLEFSDFGLLIPASDLVSLASPQQMSQRAEDVAQACGSIIFQDEPYSIFCLNPALQLEQSVTPTHTAIALLRCENYHFGIACHSLVKVEQGKSARYSIPPSMVSRRQPFTEFMILNQRACGLSSATLLLELLQNLLTAQGARIHAKSPPNPSIRRGVNS